MSERTIAAISTGLTPSGIAIVRVSGPDAVAVSDRVFSGKKPLNQVKSHTIHHGFIKDRDEIVDEVLVSLMRAPHTFTGEDTVEINCHGGSLVAKKILELLFSEGAFPAEPGEFTKRAFLNGRMDLARAEAVMDVISAENDFALKAGVRQLRGEVSRRIREIREAILDECAFIEAALDDPEHYSLEGYGEMLLKRLQPLRDTLETLIKRADEGAVLKEGVRTVISGRPNAGKSTLFNLLLGEEKAIVTEIEGTTRDVLETTVRLSGISLLLSDTAGLREARDKVEEIGIDRAKKAALDADLILYLVDAGTGLTAEDRRNLLKIKGIPFILLFSKADLVPDQKPVFPEEIREMGAKACIFLSSKTGEGLQTLRETILSLFDAEAVKANQEVIITSERQKVLLKQAFSAVSEVLSGIESGLSEEFLTVDLLNAYRFLGEIIGEEVSDDVIDRVFEKFCMGK